MPTTAHTVLASLRGIPTFICRRWSEPNDIEAAEKQGDNRALNRPKRTVTARQAALIGKRKTARDELFRRLSVRREIPAFHPEATQQVMNLESPLRNCPRRRGIICSSYRQLGFHRHDLERPGSKYRLVIRSRNLRRTAYRPRRRVGYPQLQLDPEHSQETATQLIPGGQIRRKNTLGFSN